MKNPSADNETIFSEICHVGQRCPAPAVVRAASGFIGIGGPAIC